MPDTGVPDVPAPEGSDPDLPEPAPQRVGKGVARLLQRAGRSGHSPGRASRVTLVPTHALELLEAAAARDAIALGRIEARPPPDGALDVLVQHLVTIGAGTGFMPEALYAEIRDTHAYRELSESTWRWAIVARLSSMIASFQSFSLRRK